MTDRRQPGAPDEAAAPEPARRSPVTVAYRSDVDPVDWSRRYDEGLVPDRLPYGLHKLAERGFDLTWASVPPVGRAQKLGQVVVPPRRAGAGSDAPVLAWDEYSAVRALAALPGRPLAAGVIWASDALGSGPRGRLGARSMLRALRGLSSAWALSTAQLPVLREAWGRRGPSIEFVRFGIAADYFTPGDAAPGGGTDASTQASADDVEPSVVSIGNDRDRDHATLLEAFALVRRARPDVRLRVQLRGETELPEGVERVPFLSHAELRDLYRRTRVVAVATRPNLHVSGMTTALEAMATARPIVMTRTPGIRDYVSEDRGGRLAEPGDAAGLAAGILAALEPGSASQLGALGRAAVEREFSTDLLAGRLATLLRSV